MDENNLVFKYMQYVDDSEDEMDESEVDEMQHMFMAASLDEGGSSRRRGPRISRQIIPRDHEGGHKRIWADYFDEKPVYGPRMFRRR